MLFALHTPAAPRLPPQPLRALPPTCLAVRGQTQALPPQVLELGVDAVGIVPAVRTLCLGVVHRGAPPARARERGHIVWVHALRNAHNVVHGDRRSALLRCRIVLADQHGACVRAPLGRVLPTWRSPLHSALEVLCDQPCVRCRGALQIFVQCTVPRNLAGIPAHLLAVRVPDGNRLTHAA